MNTPPLWVLYNTNYPTSPPMDGGVQLSTLAIVFIALGAFIALLLIIGLIVLIYNLCRYGSCCPPSAYPICCCPSSDGGCGGCCGCYCTPCCYQPQREPVHVVRRVPSVRSIRSNGTYVGRGTRFNQGSYLVDPGTIRGGTMGRRNSFIVVGGGDGTLSRRRSISSAAPVRPQIIVANSFSEPCRTASIGRRSGLLALPQAAPSVSQGSIRCYGRGDPISMGDLDDDGDIRVIVRNQPYTSRSSIIEAAPVFDTAFANSGFDDLTIYQGGGGDQGGSCGCGGSGGGGGVSNIGYDYGYGGGHTATLDVSFDQVPEYSSGIDIVQQGSIYPTLSQYNGY